MYYSDSWDFCVLIFRSRHFHFQFSFQINECMRTSNLSDWMYVSSYLLLCISFYVVELAVGSEQKLYFCNDSSDSVSEYDSNQDNRHRTSPTWHPFRKVGLCKVGLISPGISHVACESVERAILTFMFGCLLYFQSFTILLRMLV